MIVVEPVLRPNNQAVLKKPIAKEAQKGLTPEQAMLAANFAKAMDEEGAPSPGQIAAACDVTEQAVSNWKRTGKITKENLRIVSAMTKWSVHRLLTGQVDPPPAPNPGFVDNRSISDSDWQLLDDVKRGATEDELRVIRQRAQFVRQKADELVAERKAAAAVIAKDKK